MPSREVLDVYYNRAGIGLKYHCEHPCSRFKEQTQ